MKKKIKRGQWQSQKPGEKRKTTYAGRGPGPRPAYKEPQKAQFLEKYREHGAKVHAAEAVGISPSTVNSWRRKDAAFREAFNVAKKVYQESLEIEARRRATKGVGKFVLYKGQPVMLTDKDGKKIPITDRYYSDSLLMFTLKKLDPSYRDQINHQVNVRFVTRALNDIADVVNKRVPDACPHCKTNLNLKPNIVEDLKELSKRFNVESGQTEKSEPVKVEEEAA